MREPKTWTPAKIRELRREVLKLEQAELATLLSVHSNTVARWERGEFRPDLATQRMLSHLAKEGAPA